MAATARNRIVTASLAPAWLRVVLFGSALWIAVAVARGITFALTHAVHGV